MLTNTNLLDHFPQLSDQQTSIIEHIHGPLLVIAGPGSGKTTTLALRALNLLVSGHALPQQVMLCTFSQRAARELRQCFYRAADKVGYGRDLAAGVRIGTIHSLCHHVISTQDDAIASGSDLVMLDRFQQMAFIQGKVDEIAMPNQANRFKQRWGEGDVATGLAESFNTVSERLIDPRTLTMSDNALHRAVGESYLLYTECLRHHRMSDFSYSQRWALEVLENDAGTRAPADEVRWLMVDEYQDTNYVQERLTLALAGRNGNVAVVGDDDQSIYAFRGATVRNLLNFPNHFADCSVRHLTTNYRSSSDIVDASTRWIQAAAATGSRYAKDVHPTPTDEHHYPSVVRIQAADHENEAWQVAGAVADLKRSGTVAQYSQVALLLHSVKSHVVGPYVDAMRGRDIPVVVHGERRFFQYCEVRDMVACFAHVMGWDSFGTTGDPEVDRYIGEAVSTLLPQTPLDSVLSRALTRWKRELWGLAATGQDLDRSLLDYFYVLLAVEPFLEYKGAPRQMANLAAWSQLLATFQESYGYEKVDGHRVCDMRRDFFTRFLPLALRRWTPSRDMYGAATDGDAVQVMTVHQSKGLEFPVVVAGGVDFGSRRRLQPSELDRYAPNWDPAAEAECARLDDVRRLYVALTRACDLLVLASRVELGQDAPAIWRDAVDWEDVALESLGGLALAAELSQPVHETYSVTGDILRYDTCPRRYQFFSHYGFAQGRSSAMEFGTFVHSCLEQVCRALADGAAPGSLATAVDALVANQAERLEVVCELVKEAARRVRGFLRYVETSGLRVLSSEESLMYVGDGWSVQGRVDLLAELDSRLAVVDLKSGSPGGDDSMLEWYRQQVALYGLMMEQSLGRSVDGLGLCWVGGSGGDHRAAMDLRAADGSLEGMRELLSRTVEGIRARDFRVLKPPSIEICLRCDLFTLCRQDGTAVAGHDGA